VGDKDYHVPFKLGAKPDKLTIKIGRPRLTPEDEKKLMQTEAGAGDTKKPRVKGRIGQARRLTEPIPRSGLR